MEISDFNGKPFPCPVCNVTLRLMISLKQKPYCTCLECGIQIFFRGQTGIKRLYKIVESEEAVSAEFSGSARAISLFNRQQGLKRQKEALEDKQGFFSYDSDRESQNWKKPRKTRRKRNEKSRYLCPCFEQRSGAGGIFHSSAT